jgi:hypothetical protein
MRSQAGPGHDGESHDGESHDVDKIIRLHHRRRGWAWVGFGSLIGLVIYFIIGVTLLVNLTGTAATISLIPIFVLFALAVAGLVTAIVDSIRLGRFSESARRKAKSNVVHAPIYAHAHRYPPRHGVSWVAGLFMFAALVGLTVIFLPWEVNSVGYLTGTESTTTFHPVSYAQDCGRGGCSTVTDGFLDDSGADVIWDSQVPLNKSFTVRVPVWNWGIGHNLIEGDGTAIAGLIVGLIFDGFAVMLISILVMVTRIRRRSGNLGRAAPAAGYATGAGQAAFPVHKWTPGTSGQHHYQAMRPASGDIGSDHERWQTSGQPSADDMPADEDPS